MKKTIKIKFLEGGASLQVTVDAIGSTNPHTQTFVYPFSKYSQSEIKDEKFYVPASQEIFKDVCNEFKVLRYSFESKFEVSVRKLQNGHYITISQYNKIIKEFITEVSEDVTYSILLRRLLEVLFFSNNRVPYDESAGKTLEFEIVS